MNNNLIPFTKAWNYPDGGGYDEKPYWFNPAIEIKGIEPCKLKKDGKVIECTKIFYPNNYLTILGTPQEFFAACRNANITICLLNDLVKEGITIKEFLKQTERLNGVEFH